MCLLRGRSIIMLVRARLVACHVTMVRKLLVVMIFPPASVVTRVRRGGFERDSHPEIVEKLWLSRPHDWKRKESVAMFVLRRREGSIPMKKSVRKILLITGLGMML